MAFPIIPIDQSPVYKPIAAMRILSTAVVAVAAIACADAFSTNSFAFRSQRTTSLSLQNEDSDASSIKSRMGAAVAGLAVASQVAFVANPAVAAPTPIVTSQGKRSIADARLR